MSSKLLHKLCDRIALRYRQQIKKSDQTLQDDITFIFSYYLEQDKINIGDILTGKQQNKEVLFNFGKALFIISDPPAYLSVKNNFSFNEYRDIILQLKDFSSLCTREDKVPFSNVKIIENGWKDMATNFIAVQNKYK